MDKCRCKRNEKIIHSVLNKWKKDRAQLGGFMRFVDGNRGNMHVDNMTVVPLVDALENPEWVVDWDLVLRTHEKRFVKRHMKHFHTMVAQLLENGKWRTYESWKTR